MSRPRSEEYKTNAAKLKQAAREAVADSEQCVMKHGVAKAAIDLPHAMILGCKAMSRPVRQSPKNNPINTHHYMKME
ncbi:hypothetical protein RJ639_001640 [Escallonia herrerae]|uniref:Uncharacterized protein n=1 Tax=Escallonia herrerae TaxID=1293975 RepID=A0AA88XAQ2_9ASTE|nr:hypothetical protein RJ639_001640 [Escallonia herrerae]